MDPSDKITAFDSLFTTNHIQMLKILLSFTKPPLQGKLAVYIRFLEFQYTLNFIKANPHAAVSSPETALFPFAPGPNATDNASAFHDLGGVESILRLLDEVLPYCNLHERRQLLNFQNTLKNMENMQQTMEMLRMLQETFPEMFHPSGSVKESPDGSPKDFSGVPGIQPEELMQMADMINMLFQTDQSNNRSENSENGGQPYGQ